MATKVDELQVVISANSAAFQKGINQAIGQINVAQNSARKAMGGVGAGAVALGSIVANALTAAMNAVAQATGQAVSRLDTLNNFPKVMSNLGISSEDSSQSINYLSEKLKGLPTSLDDAALAVQRLTSANGDIKGSTALFLAMNNAIMAGGAPAELQASAMEQLSQAYAKGVPDMMEWRTMMMAMPAQLKQVATAMNFASADQLGEALRNGQVSMNDFMNTIMRLNNEGLPGFQSFEQQARNSTGGVATALANLRNAVVRAVADVMNAIGQANISGFINAISSAINSAVPYIVGFTRVVMDAVAWVVGLFGGTIKTTKTVQTSASTASSAVGGIASSANDASKSLGGVSGGAGKAGKALGGANKEAKKLKGTLASFDEMNVLTEPAKANTGSGGSGGGGGGGGGAPAGGGGGALTVPEIDFGSMDGVKNKADEVYNYLKKLFSDFASIFDFKKIGGAFSRFGDDIMKALQPIGKIALDIWNDYLKPFIGWTGNSLLPAVLNAIGGAIRFVGEVLGTVWSAFLKPFVDAFLVPIAKFTGGVIVTVLNGIGDGLRGLSESKPAVQFISGLVVAIGGLATAIKIKNEIDLFNNGIKTMQALALSSSGGVQALMTKLGAFKGAFVLAGGGVAGLKAGFIALGGAIKTSVLSAFNAVMAHPLILGATALVAGITWIGGSIKSAMEQGSSSTWKAKANAEALKTAQDLLKTSTEGVKKAEDELFNARAGRVDAEIAYNQAIDTQAEAQGKLAAAQDKTGLSFGALKAQVDSGGLSYATMNAQQKEVYNAGLALDQANQQVTASQAALKDATDKVSASSQEAKKAREDEIASQIVAQATSDATSGKYKSMKDALKDLTSKTFEYKDANGNMVKVSKEEIAGLSGKIQEETQRIKKSYQESMSGADQGFFGPMGRSLRWAGDGIADLAGKAGRWLGKMAGDFGKSARDAWNGFTGALGGLGAWMGDRWNDVKNAFGNAWGTFRDIGRNILDGIGAGIGNMGQWLKNKFNGAVDAIKNFLGIHSPSKLFAEIGRYMGMGTVQGLESQVQPFVRASRQMAQAGASAFNGYSVSTPDLSSKLNSQANSLNQTIAKNRVDMDYDLATTIRDNSQTQVVVKIGDEKLVDRIIKGINDKSFMSGYGVINI